MTPSKGADNPLEALQLFLPIDVRLPALRRRLASGNDRRPRIEVAAAASHIGLCCRHVRRPRLHLPLKRVVLFLGNDAGLDQFVAAHHLAFGQLMLCLSTD